MQFPRFSSIEVGFILDCVLDCLGEYPVQLDYDNHSLGPFRPSSEATRRDKAHNNQLWLPAIRRLLNLKSTLPPLPCLAMRLPGSCDSGGSRFPTTQGGAPFGNEFSSCCDVTRAAIAEGSDRQGVLYTLNYNTILV